jgi:solute:Na+ symporter, SSS family
MLILFIVIYFIITIAIGLYANRKIKGDVDFINAGRNLHPAINAFALFALWFGSETLFGSSAEFANNGLRGVIEDPFGGILCLLLVGFVYSKKMYRLNVLTIGDLFERQFGEKIEILASVLMIFSFVGYIAAQLLALGLILKVLLGISLPIAIILSSIVVASYTIAGGMLAVSLTDFIQSIMIIIGLIAIAVFLTDKAGGYQNILASVPKEHWKILPENTPRDWINWFASWTVLGLGSIVSQDIFQRVNSARSEKAAYYSSIFGAIIYGLIAFLPMFLIVAIKLVYPQYVDGDLQLSLPQMVLENLPMGLKILFFGSVVSAIMSTASGAILAPASLASENILKPLFYRNASHVKLLFITRISIACLTCLSVFLALGSETIYSLVGESSVFGLVSIFVPFTAALFFDYRNKTGALASMILGSTVWAYFRFFDEPSINPLVFGTSAALFGLLFGFFDKQKIKSF